MKANCCAIDCSKRLTLWISILCFQAQRAILDTELDIINKQHEGADTSELRRRVAELKQEVCES